MSAPFYEDIEVGQEIPAVEKTPSNMQLFMFSAATWNLHRIHYDADFAREHDGLPNVLAHRPLLGSFLSQVLTHWVGDNGRVRRLEWSNRGPAVPGDRLSCRGRVTDKRKEAGRGIIECDVWVEKENGEVIVPGKAVVEMASRAARKRDGTYT